MHPLLTQYSAYNLWANEHFAGLLRKLAPELLEEALSGSGYDWLEQAALVRQKRFGRSLPSDMKEKARQLRFLQYRGFTGSQVSQALRCELPVED